METQTSSRLPWKTTTINLVNDTAIPNVGFRDAQKSRQGSKDVSRKVGLNGLLGCFPPSCNLFIMIPPMLLSTRLSLITTRVKNRLAVRGGTNSLHRGTVPEFKSYRHQENTLGQLTILLNCGHFFYEIFKSQIAET